MFGFEFIFFIMFFFVFGLVLAIIITTLVKNLKQWNKNNNSPRLTVDATVVSKRIAVSHHHNAGELHYMNSATHYYVTFQVASGDRMELNVVGNEYGMLVEGDYGMLTFQGTRYLSFQRT